MCIFVPHHHGNRQTIPCVIIPEKVLVCMYIYIYMYINPIIMVTAITDLHIYCGCVDLH